MVSLVKQLCGKAAHNTHCYFPVNKNINHINRFKKTKLYEIVKPKKIGKMAANIILLSFEDSSQVFG